MSELFDDIPEMEFDQPDNKLITDTDSELDVQKSQVHFTLDDLPVHFTTQEDLQAYVNDFTYFGRDLKPVMAKWNSLQHGVTPATEMLKSQQELWVMQRLLTIQKWGKHPTEQDRKWYYGKMTSSGTTYPTNTDKVLKLTKMGSHMTKAEWEIYKAVFDVLYKEFEAGIGPEVPVVNPRNN